MAEYTVILYGEQKEKVMEYHAMNKHEALTYVSGVMDTLLSVVNTGEIFTVTVEDSNHHIVYTDTNE